MYFSSQNKWVEDEFSDGHFICVFCDLRPPGIPEEGIHWLSKSERRERKMLLDIQSNPPDTSFQNSESNIVPGLGLDDIHQIVFQSIFTINWITFHAGHKCCQRCKYFHSSRYSLYWIIIFRYFQMLFDFISADFLIKSSE